MAVTERYRANVAAILQKPDGEILVGERSGVKGAWQFPQGGVDEGEELESALARELEEEVGVVRRHYEIVKSMGGYRYDYPKNHRKKGSFDGQEQTYFLCRFLGMDTDVSVEDSPEFRRVRWIAPEDFKKKWLPDFKRKVYARVLEDFFGVKL